MVAKEPKQKFPRPFRFGGRVTNDGLTLAHLAKDFCQSSIFDLSMDGRSTKSSAGQRIWLSQKELLDNSQLYIDRIPKEHIYMPDSGDQLVSPETALYWLTMNTRNRTISDGRVLKLSEAIMEGLWTNTGDPITFCTEDGGRSHYIISGQARLWAQWATNCTVEHTLRYTDDIRVAGNIDTGKTRSISDLLSAKKYPKHLVLGGVANIVRGYQEFDPPFLGAPNWNSVPKYPSNQLLEYIEAHPELVEAIVNDYPDLNQCRRMFGSPVWASALCYLTMSNVGTTKLWAKQFWGDLESGVGLEQGDPVLLIRENLIRNSVQNKKWDKLSIGAMVIKAWNLRKLGHSVSQIRWAQAKEAFPTII